MEKIVLTLFTVLTFLSVSGQMAPDFTFTDINGESHTLSESLAEGKVVLLDFFFVDCGPCVSWAPEIEAVIGEYEGTTLEVWSISDRDSDSYIAGSVFNPTHSNHLAGGVNGAGDAAVDLYANNFAFTGFPTFALVCNDGSITWDIWPLSAGVPEIRNLLTEDCGVSGLSAVTTIEGLNDLRIYPNPASGATTLEFGLEQSTTMTVQVFNTLGQMVSTVPAQEYSAGAQTVGLDVSSLANGMYVVRMLAEEGMQSLGLTVSK